MCQLGTSLRSHSSETWHNAAKIVEVDWEKINSNADLIPSPSNISSLTEPPATMEPFYNDEEILAVAADPDLFDLAGLPGHTQPVERMVGLATKIVANYAPSAPPRKHSPQKLLRARSVQHFGVRDQHGTIQDQTELCAATWDLALSFLTHAT